MGIEYKIHPSIGVARLGNSSEFYLSPIKIGGRPIECENQYGDEAYEQEEIKYVRRFKDKQKRVKKQAAKFKIFKHDSSKTQPEEIDLSDKTLVKNVKWTVHLANKKASWFHFTEFKGDLMLGEHNTYENRPDRKDADKRNQGIDEKNRKHLIVDYGPRYVDSPKMRLQFMNDQNIPHDYPFSAPWHQRDHSPIYGKRVDFLGEIISDSKNNLIVLGGHGNSGGDELFSTFAGGETWYDDISDGPVTCEITFSDDSTIILDAWIIVGPPKFAPELVNITTLDDVMLDMAVQHFDAAPEIYTKENGWNPNYEVSFERDIEPIIKSIGGYRWVANVPSMMDFCMPSFDLRDNSEKNLANRKNYFEYFRKSGEKYWGVGGQSEQLFSNDDYLEGIPLMPLNAGSNAVSNSVPDKFVELSRTQHYFLEQWSKGKFTIDKSDDILGILELDHADVGNCAGAPLCPGIEVTWSIKNPSIYEGPYKIKHKNKNPETGEFDLNYYFEHGLDPNWDETAVPGELGGGCEPGDLTKRMADPWVSDLFECNINHINFTDADRVITAGFQLEDPPTYLAYWWPPQSPWDVILGVSDPDEPDPRKRKEKVIAELKAAGASTGQQVNFIRGIHNHIEMVYAWSYLGFIVNQNEAKDREDYPYFVEKERNHEEFEVSAVAVANKINIVDPFGIRLEQGYHLKKDIIEFSKDDQ